MPVQVLHGVSPKPSRLVKSSKPLRGTDPMSRIQASQHATLDVQGYTYNSPFTYSSENLFPVGVSTSTPAKIAPIQSEGAGNPVPTAHFVKVQPHEKGNHFSTTKAPRPIVYRAGGPAKTHDTAVSPNHPSLKHSPKPKKRPLLDTTNNASTPSFLKTGGTMTGHATAQTNTSKPRWDHIKTGAAG